MRHTISTSLVFLVLFLFLSGCGPIKETVRQTTYVDTHKAPEDKTFVVELPKVELPPGTDQLLVKGGVTISCEVAPFSLERTEVLKESVTYADPNAPGYDVYEVVKEPVYSIKPDEFQFKIRIKNNQDRVLKLFEMPIILIIDGIQTSIPESAFVDWKAALVVKGFEKEFQVNGPKLSAFEDAKLIYIGVHDVPILYDEAGNVKKKENFEWTFQLTKQEVSQPDKIVYTYNTKPVYKEQCKACNGVGYFKEVVQCSSCNGSGIRTNKEGKSSKCYGCGGSGKVTQKRNCDTCSGLGVLAYPKSQKPPVAKEVVWTGWKVRVETNPPGAKVSVVDVNTAKYKDAGASNIEVRWFSSSQSYPIIVEYQDKQVKVLPFTLDGKASRKVVIDFLSASQPVVQVGRKVE
ncbi:hypothetical protein FJZ31_39245 [Candidatus Poribacteria bacterium]|nr:hypothetical protein [Candidatus Poribacteria bacterium]